MTDDRDTVRVIVQQWISLDGLASGPADEMDIMDVVDERADAKSQAYNLEFLDQATAVLLGRHTYEKFVEYWPTATEAIAARVNEIPKVVASTTLEAAPWGEHPPAEITGDPVGYVQRFRADQSGTLVVWGSLDLTASLLAAGEVDELDQFVAPVWVGEGRSLLKTESATRLRQLASEDWGTITHSRYRIDR